MEVARSIKNVVGRDHAMKTIVEKVDCNHPEYPVIKKAAVLLQKGGLVAFPTETVYGLGANGLSADACKKIYEAKGRPSDNPLILHIAELSQLDQIVSEIPVAGQKAIEAFWPGPLTIIFPKADCVPLQVTGGLNSVAVRFPSNAVAQALIRACGLPVAAPSANSSGKPSPTRASHVEFDLNGVIDMILDGGAATVGLESTILDVTGEKPQLLRPGAITKEMLEEVLGEIEVDRAILEKPAEDWKPKAPGMKYIHYAPKARVILVKGEKEQVIQKINLLIAEERKKGVRVGVIATDQTKEQYVADVVLSLGDREKLETIASNLFKILRKTDYLKLETVYTEAFEEIGEGAAIMNRLKKAAGYRIIEV